MENCAQVLEDLNSKINELSSLELEVDDEANAKIDVIKEKVITVLKQASTKIEEASKNLSNPEEVEKIVVVVSEKSNKLYKNALKKINGIVKKYNASKEKIEVETVEETSSEQTALPLEEVSDNVETVDDNSSENVQEIPAESNEVIQENDLKALDVLGGSNEVAVENIENPIEQSEENTTEEVVTEPNESETVTEVVEEATEETTKEVIEETTEEVKEEVVEETVEINDAERLKERAINIRNMQYQALAVQTLKEWLKPEENK